MKKFCWERKQKCAGAGVGVGAVIMAQNEVTSILPLPTRLRLLLLLVASEFERYLIFMGIFLLFFVVALFWEMFSNSFRPFLFFF